MRDYVYSCQSCGDVWEFPHRWNEDAETICLCGAELRRVPQAPRVMFRGSRFVNGDRKIAEFTTKNRDGSDVTYTSLQGAYRGELGRGVHPAIARKNVEYIGKMGYVPGTDAHAFKAACLANNREGK